MLASSNCTPAGSRPARRVGTRPEAAGRRGRDQRLTPARTPVALSGPTSAPHAGGPR
jgi:hypothetical protein